MSKSRNKTTPVQIRATPYELACLDLHGETRAAAMRGYIARYDALMRDNRPELSEEEAATLRDVMRSNPGGWHPDECANTHELGPGLAGRIFAHGGADSLAERAMSWTPMQVFAAAYAVEMLG